MNIQPQPRPLVPGGSCRPGHGGSRTSAGAGGAKNPRANQHDRQNTTTSASTRNNNTLNVLTYNARTLMMEERMVELKNALQTINYDIIGLSEVRREGELTTETESDIFYYNGISGGQYGVGFLVAKKWKQNIEEFVGYSERIAVLKLKISQHHTATFIQTYAPTSSHSNEEIEDFYDLLNRAYDENKGTWTLVLGDFNAKIGIRNDSDNFDVLGPFGLGDRNERGSRLIQFAFGQRLSISNTFFYKKSQRRWTWVSPDGRTRNEIDFVLTSSKHIIKDISVINNINFSSDHRPLRAKINFNLKIHRAKCFANNIKRLDKLTLMSYQEQFNIELKNQFSILPDYEKGDVQTSYDNIVKSIKVACKNIKPKRQNSNKLSQDTMNLIKSREQLDKFSEGYRQLDRRVKRSIRRDLRAFNTKLVEIALLKHRSLRAAKHGNTTGKSWITSLKDKDGRKHTNRQKIVEICTSFYKDLYADTTRDANSNDEYTFRDNIPLITGYEVHVALKSMQYEKSPGEDGVTTESLKIGEPTLLPHLANLCNDILVSGKFPLKFCHSNIILLHKKGEKSDIGNYRPVSLTSHIYKLFIKIIHNRIRSLLDHHQPPEQAGFRPGYSTTDHLHTLNQIIEKTNEFNTPLYLAFIDYTKAFDSLHHQAIFSALANQKINPTYIELVGAIYRNSTANVKLERPGPAFPIEKGVKQGDPLSPNLFTSCLEEVFKKLTQSWENKGIDIGGHKLTNLRFADDIVLFSHSAPELQQMLRELSTASLEVGLMMNRSKTKVMTNSTKRRVEVDGQEIQYVNEYIYLGQIASFENRQDKEIDRRIENAWKSFWSMKSLMKGNLPLSLKRKLIDMCILPVLTYGAQTWSLTESQKSKLKVCQRAMERSILGVKRTDRIRNTDLRSKTQIADVGAKTAKLKWDWAGHVCRMQPERWAKNATKWIPNNGRRRRGRPRKRWRDDLDNFNTEWCEQAQERDKWNVQGETFAQQWDNRG
ncbi:unnamed protein product [Plutella xylostella]|uniref:(diamondback moth) hypothetical protein n=1 Tax=Plutella xylostella TaxID=51655 RepID=A0A8S4G2Y8_PLUXY|nr:unnamed protein product [Plutella xylostella]